MVGPQVRKALIGAQQEMLDHVVPTVQAEIANLQERWNALARNFLQQMARQTVRTLAEPLEAAFSGDRSITERFDRLE